MPAGVTGVCFAGVVGVVLGAGVTGVCFAGVVGVVLGAGYLLALLPSPVSLVLVRCVRASWHLFASVVECCAQVPVSLVLFCRCCWYCTWRCGVAGVCLPGVALALYLVLVSLICLPGVVEICSGAFGCHWRFVLPTVLTLYPELESRNFIFFRKFAITLSSLLFLSLCRLSVFLSPYLPNSCHLVVFRCFLSPYLLSSLCLVVFPEILASPLVFFLVFLSLSSFGILSPCRL